MAQMPSASNNKVEDAANDLADRIEANAGTAGGATGSDVQADLEALRRDIAALTQTVASFGSSKIRQAGETSQQYVDSARESIANVEDELEAYVHQRPFQSLAIAAGVGYVLALLTRR
ncbi:Membrane-anchored ribosome-binding protein, inhibits growth in stationary phase, ElaB/YqjD/DUF883 family [Rhizobium sp. RU33A]|uniref:DUF883 family protein n=1 Tax=Rhizobium sp. RU33A TaxID=1907413 RepID=UPI000955D535|nr:DUF883 family protein [Rhizobium sp. RU33A]SIQ22697.1 Membrane-anchored ribosome-binding protein, inhibits growth in stationary phase, ElaB/YqjD/DUF883 family [Rhizobium sp. RU33A]